MGVFCSSFIKFADTLHAVEVKDKTFSKADINHALGKVVEAGHNTLIFAIGCHAAYDIQETLALSKKAAKNGLDLSFVAVSDLCLSLLSVFGEAQRQEFFNEVYNILHEMRAKDGTVRAFKKLLDIKKP